MLDWYYNLYTWDHIDHLTGQSYTDMFPEWVGFIMLFVIVISAVVGYIEGLLDKPVDENEKIDYEENPIKYRIFKVFMGTIGFASIGAIFITALFVAVPAVALASLLAFWLLPWIILLAIILSPVFIIER